MKSTITRERLQEIAAGQSGFNLRTATHEESQELACLALAAMDSSESIELPLDYLQGHKDGLEWASQLAEANHPETGDWLYDDPIALAKAIRKGPDMPPAQPAPVVPEDVRQALSKMDDEIIAELDAEENACRAVMLDNCATVESRNNAGCSPKNGLKCAAMFQDEPVTTANKFGNSPVIPDTWIPVSERMPLPAGPLEVKGE